MASITILILGCEPKPEQINSKVSNNQQRVGIYDSRSIAIAYVNSPTYIQQVQPVMDRKHEAYTKALKDGDTQTANKIKAWGQAQQTQLHLQAFSTQPVDEILKQIADRLPMIKQQAGVSRLVSKWDQEAMAAIKGSEQIDITMNLIDTLQPTAMQRQAAIDIQQHHPITLSQAKQIND